MKRIFLLFLLIAGASLLRAQEIPHSTRVVAERQNRNVVLRVTDKTYPGAETILLTISDLQNCNATMGTTPYVVRHDGVLIPGHGKSYTPVVTHELITCEMSRKELKKRDGNKK